MIPMPRRDVGHRCFMNSTTYNIKVKSALYTAYSDRAAPCLINSSFLHTLKTYATDRRSTLRFLLHVYSQVAYRVTFL